MASRLKERVQCGMENMEKTNRGYTDTGISWGVMLSQGVEYLQNMDNLKECQ